MRSAPVFGHSTKKNVVVHVVDSDPKTCKTLCRLFRLEGFAVNCSLTLEHFETSIKQCIPRVVVSNLRLSDGEGLPLLHLSRAKHPDMIFVMLANSADIPATVSAMKLGAVDVFLKPLDLEHLVQAVNNALRKDVILGVSDGGIRKLTIGGFSSLTPREREVLQLIVDGKSNNIAATLIGISPRTVEVHRARAMKKLGAHNTVELMRAVLGR